MHVLRTRLLEEVGGRLVGLVALACLVALVAIVVVLAGAGRLTGDLGGHILADLRSVGSAVPANGAVLSRSEHEPQWTCDRGWDPVRVTIRFSTSTRADDLTRLVDKRLTAEGWTAGGDGRSWTKRLWSGEDEWVSLSAESPDTWRLLAGAEPDGPRVGFCE